MEWIVEAEDLDDLMHGRYSLKTKPLVRCKDCAKREYCRTSTVWAIPPKDDWFCADAERRTDESD